MQIVIDTRRDTTASIAAKKYGVEPATIYAWNQRGLLKKTKEIKIEESPGLKFFNKAELDKVFKKQKQNPRSLVKMRSRN